MKRRSNVPPRREAMGGLAKGLDVMPPKFAAFARELDKSGISMDTFIEMADFLSDEWINEARAIRERHDGDHPPMTQSIRINLVVNGAPFGGGTVRSSLDTSSGDPVLELGELDSPDVTLTTDYETAKTIFVAQDPAAGMQAFMTGKVVVQGDMMKLMTLQAVLSANPDAEAISAEIRAITA